MITVEKLLEHKGRQVWTVTPENTVFESIEIMDEKGVGALAVVIKGALVGIVSERDYARKVMLKGLSVKDTLIKDIMTTHVYHTVMSQPIDECLVMMNERRIRHIPVVEDEKLVGMVSVGDVVKEIINEQQYTIKQLENYISWEESY